MCDLSVVLVSYNTSDLLRDCLQSLYAHKPDLSLEVWVVDNGSKDGSGEMVRKDFPGVRLIQNCLNLGFARAANEGIQRSKGRYIMLLNPDTRLLPGSVYRLVRFMDEHPDAGVAGAKLLYPDGTLQLTCRRFPKYSLLLFGRESLLTRFFPKNRFSRRYMLADLDYNEVQEVDFVAGAAMMVRRKAFEEVGLLDEGFFLFAEDTDLCYRLKERGWKVYFVPEAPIIHRLGASMAKERGRAVLEHHRSFYRFLTKHYRPSLFMRALLKISIAFKVVILSVVRRGGGAG